MPFTPEELAELVKAPEKTQTDEGYVQERKIKDVLEAQDKIDAGELGDQPLHGLRISRCCPAGPV